MIDPFETIVRGGSVAIDRREVRRALPILIGPGEAHEFRALPSGRGRVMKIDDLDATMEQVERLADEQVYWTLNPVAPDARRANKKSVLSRRWFLIDVDTVRPKGCSSSEPEKIGAACVCGAILEHLLGEGWPAPVMVDSGNGWHLLYRVDMPNDPLSQQVLKAASHALGERFDCSRAVVDRATHDAPRVSKLPGTLARKGPDTVDRPHRFARIVYEPDNLEVVPVELLKALGGPASPSGPNGMPPHSPWETTVGAGRGMDAYVRGAIEGECGKLALATAGVDRNRRMNDAAFALGQFDAWPEMDSAAARSALKKISLGLGLPAREVEYHVERGWADGAKHPRPRPADPAANGKPIIPGKLIIWASDVKPRRVEWLWPNRVPLGKMTTFAGNTGMGKTFTVCDMAARISRGSEIPFGSGECFRQGKVLFVSSEDDVEDTLVPRLMELGADLTRIAFLSPESEDQFNLAALELLNRLIDQMMGDVRLVAIDPPTSYLGRVDDHKNAELRGLLTPLKRWSSDRRVALIFNTHVNKPSSQKVEATARVMGSVAWVAAVRAAHMFCPDPDDPSRNLFVPLKVNIGEKPRGIAYRLVKTRDLARIEWLEESDTTADDAVANVKKPNRAVIARDWLVARFRERLEWTSEELETRYRAAGISRNAFFDAKDSLGGIINEPIKNAAGKIVGFKNFVRPNWPHLFDRDSGDSGTVVSDNSNKYKDLGNQNQSPESGPGSGTMDQENQSPRVPESQSPGGERRQNSGQNGGDDAVIHEFFKPY